MPTVTRKIQVGFNTEDKNEIKSLYDKVFAWQRMVYRAANWVATHQYIQENIKDLHYFTDGEKVKLANIEKDADGILTMSKTNTTYQVLSKNFKGEAPMGMMSAVNTNVTKIYQEEKIDVKNGIRSLRTYKRTLPMPVRSADISNWMQLEDGNYSFFVYGINFRTWFGRDLSGNKIMMQRAQEGKYKLCDSSIQLKKQGNKWRMFLLAVFSFEKEKISVNPKLIAECTLGIKYPLIVQYKNKTEQYLIGTKDEYMHGRLAIRGAMNRLQKELRYSGGGKGRQKKLAALERFHDREKNYIDNKMHMYSRMLINFCIKQNIGKIVLSNYKEAVEETHQDTDESRQLLSSWSYYNLADKIKYKAAQFEIEVDVLECKPLDRKSSLKK